MCDCWLRRLQPDPGMQAMLFGFVLLSELRSRDAKENPLQNLNIFCWEIGVFTLAEEANYVFTLLFVTL